MLAAVIAGACNCGVPMADRSWMLVAIAALFVGSVVTALVTRRARAARVPTDSLVADNDLATLPRPD